MNGKRFDSQNAHSRLREIEQREWFLLCCAVLVIFLLTWAVLTFSYRSFHQNADAFYIFQLQQAVRALVGLVLLFAIYSLRLQIELHRMRRRFTAEVATIADVEDNRTSSP